MNELKARTARSIADEEEMLELGADCSIEPAQVYLKSEADKAIADLEESHKMEVEQLLMEIVELKGDYKEACDRLQTANLIKDEQLAATRHSNYKRCLAMARWCRIHDEFTQLESERSGLSQRALFIEYRRKAMWWNKWHNRWLELAEKFKEAK